MHSQFPSRSELPLIIPCFSPSHQSLLPEHLCTRWPYVCTPPGTRQAFCRHQCRLQPCQHQVFPLAHSARAHSTSQGCSPADRQSAQRDLLRERFCWRKCSLKHKTWRATCVAQKSATEHFVASWVLIHPKCCLLPDITNELPCTQGRLAAQKAQQQQLPRLI